MFADKCCGAKEQVRECLRLTGRPENEAAGAMERIGRISAGASKAEESEDGLTPDELKEVVREALKLIDSNGLDSPEGHLEFVRRKLRAAVAW